MHDYIKMQVDEIDTMSKLVSKTKAFDSMPGLLWHLDAELS